MILHSQQAVSALTNLNASVFADGGAQFTKFGVEYWSNPDNRGEGFIEWIADEPVFRITANTFTADQSLGISDRLIAEEPMAIMLNLAVSRTTYCVGTEVYIVPDYRFNPSLGSFQNVDYTAMTFPAELRFDYVRVWQRKGLQNGVGCDPPSKFGYLPTFFRHWNNLCRSADSEVYQRVSLSILSH